jgi:integrase/recombinase XerD
MKKLELCTRTYKAYLAQFETHLQTLNYSKGTVYGSVNNVKEFLFFLEQQKLELLSVTSKELTEYFAYLQNRTNLRRGGGLSASYLNKHHHGLSLFFDYLIFSDVLLIKPIISVFKKTNYIPTVLTTKEMEQLFNACTQKLLGKRDKALLALYYGLGLRKKEGIQLKVEDVDLEKEEVFIAQSKTHRQRRVPMSEHVKTILEEYLFNVREKLVPSDKSVDAFLVTEKGNALSNETPVLILRKLLKEAKITTPASLHTLRHSIATHLLQSGMKLENIALFLGHRSLDSTQIYTHININQDENI